MLTRWDPFAELSGLSQRGGAGLAERHQPAVDIFEDKECVYVKAEVPGFAPEQLNVDIDNNVLTLSGEYKDEQASRRGEVHHIERSYGSFTRSFVLPPNVHSEASEARLENGVLTVRLPKKSSNSARRIAVRTEDRGPRDISQRVSDPGGSWTRPPGDS